MIELTNTPVVRLEQETPNYPVTIHLTKEGYVYKFKGSQEPTLKPGDEVIRIFETTNDSQLLIFSKDVLCYKLDISRIEETRASSLGTYLPATLKVPDLEIVSYSVLDDKQKMIIAVYKNNRVAKISMKVFGGNRRILKNAYNPNQGLVDLLTLEDEAKLNIVTDKTKVEVDTKTLSLATSRIATGVYCTRKGTTKKVEVA